MLIHDCNLNKYNVIQTLSIRFLVQNNKQLLDSNTKEHDNSNGTQNLQVGASSHCRPQTSYLSPERAT